MSVVKMANQIALNVPDRVHPARATANHLRSFWAPSMIDELLACVAQDPTCVNDIVLEALSELREVSHG